MASIRAFGPSVRGTLSTAKSPPSTRAAANSISIALPRAGVTRVIQQQQQASLHSGRTVASAPFPSSSTTTTSHLRQHLAGYGRSAGGQSLPNGVAGNGRLGGGLVQSRSIFIQTQDTPNQDALKFLPSSRVLPEDFNSPFLEYLSPRSTLAPPHPSPLASQLLSVDGVTAVFYGPDYITVTKASDVPWAHVKPEVFSLITEAVTSGQPIVNSSASASASAGKEDGASDEQAGGVRDSLQHDEQDDEVVQMIKELLETRIRPAIQEDGGDIEYRGFEGGNVMLKLRGACRTCDSSTVTLKNGIENMLMHYIEEVKSVSQVLDEEEEVSLQEFAKFEEKLKQQKGEAAIAGSGGKGTLDAAEA